MKTTRLTINGDQLERLVRGEVVYWELETCADLVAPQRVGVELALDDIGDEEILDRVTASVGRVTDESTHRFVCDCGSRYRSEALLYACKARSHGPSTPTLPPEEVS